jgi:hypothetical protein
MGYQRKYSALPETPAVIEERGSRWQGWNHELKDLELQSTPCDDSVRKCLVRQSSESLATPLCREGQY